MNEQKLIESNRDFNYCYYCINEYHWTPKQYASLSLKEKALVQATVDIRVKAEEKAQKEAEREAKNNR
ncbi:hypothetical protein SDC49_20305 [Lactobacillus sp. R2/2]|nr:hypothetical protein [Lactobacillus sp. R2/2]